MCDTEVTYVPRPTVNFITDTITAVYGLFSFLLTNYYIPYCFMPKKNYYLKSLSLENVEKLKSVLCGV